MPPVSSAPAFIGMFRAYCENTCLHRCVLRRYIVTWNVIDAGRYVISSRGLAIIKCFSTSCRWTFRTGLQRKSKHVRWARYFVLVSALATSVDQSWYKLTMLVWQACQSQKTLHVVDANQRNLALDKSISKALAIDAIYPLDAIAICFAQLEPVSLPAHPLKCVINARIWPYSPGCSTDS